MRKRSSLFAILTLFGVDLLLVLLVTPASAGKRRRPGVRFATFNASLNRFFEGGLILDLSTPDDEQATWHLVDQ